jgi:hypothetical protein
MKMKNLLIALLISIAFISCSNSDDNINNNNPYLTAPAVNISLSLNLPEYIDLKFPGGSVVIHSQGIKGIVVYCVTENQYVATELSDPNHIPNNCYKMEVTGILATCPCDDGNKYDIITAQFSPQDNSKYPMIQYRAIREGSVITIFN